MVLLTTISKTIRSTLKDINGVTNQKLIDAIWLRVTTQFATTVEHGYKLPQILFFECLYEPLSLAQDIESFANHRFGSFSMVITAWGTLIVWDAISLWNYGADGSEFG